MKFPILLFSCFILFLLSCHKKESTNGSVSLNGEGYFSIKQFIKDQWDTYGGQPYGMQKITFLNGKSDTALVNAFTLDWAPVLKTFMDADISDPKFIGQYNFSMFEDNTTTTRNFYYEAKNDKLFTQKFQVSADLFTDKVRSVYIETQKSGSMGTTNQKLFYIPVKAISIQELETAALSAKKDMRIEYRFL